VTALQAALEAAAWLIGPCELTEALGPTVARISARSGEEYVIKKHADRDKHDREVHAYQHWTPALGSSARNSSPPTPRRSPSSPRPSTAARIQAR